MDSKFLDGEDILSDKVCLTSYHRSGNTFMRRYLEAITSITTGADTSLDLTLSLTGQLQGLKGQEVVDDSVWIVKSHFPI